MGGDTARLKPQHFISYLYNRQATADFAKLFDDTLLDIAISNNDVFAVKTDGGAKVVLFDRLSQYIADESSVMISAAPLSTSWWTSASSVFSLRNLTSMPPCLNT